MSPAGTPGRGRYGFAITWPGWQSCPGAGVQVGAGDDGLSTGVDGCVGGAELLAGGGARLGFEDGFGFFVCVGLAGGVGM